MDLDERIRTKRPSSPPASQRSVQTSKRAYAVRWAVMILRGPALGSAGFTGALTVFYWEITPLVFRLHE